MLTNQPAQQQSSFASASDLSLDVYVWKTGKNPHPCLVPNNTNSKSDNVTLLDIGISVDAVVSGDAHVIFKTEGKLYAMGENVDGRLGVSQRYIRSSTTPLFINALSTFRVVKVACGSKHTIALVDPGEVYAWGYGGDGQLGLKNDLTQFSPQIVHLGRNEYSKQEEYIPAIDIACGANHTGVISKSGDIYTFGSGELGQLGNAKKLNEFAPFKIKIPSEKAEKIACGKFHTLVLTARGSVYGFGLNSQGQLGLGHRRNCDTPHKISFLDKHRIMKVQAGGHSVGLTFMGELYVWGPCVLGECLVPQRVCKNIEASIADVQIGANFTSILDYKGYLWGLGAQKRGEVGAESIEARSQACPITFLHNKKIKMVSCTRDAAIILAEKRTITNTSLLNKTRSLSPYKVERESARPGQRHQDVQKMIRGRMYSPQVRPGGFKDLSSMLKAWKQGEMSSFITEPHNQTEMSFSKNVNMASHDPREKSDISNSNEGEFQVREFGLNRERVAGASEGRKNRGYVGYQVEITEPEVEDKWTTVERFGTEQLNTTPKMGENIQISGIIHRNTPEGVAFEDHDNSRESIEEALSNPSQKKVTSSPKVQDQYSLEDVMNQVNSIVLPDEAEISGRAGLAGHVQTEEDKQEYNEEDVQGDKNVYENDSKINDLMQDIKSLKERNNMLESQIEQKAKEIAMLESQEDSDGDNQDEKNTSQPRINLSQYEGQILLAKSYRSDSPPKDTNKDTSYNDESPKATSTYKEKDSALMDSLIQENKNLKGLVSYLVKAKGIKIDENSLLSFEKLKKELDLQSQDNQELGSDSEALDNTLNLKTSFASWHNKRERDESPKERSVEKSGMMKSVRSSPRIEEFIVAPPPGYSRSKSPQSPIRSSKSKSNKSKSNSRSKGERSPSGKDVEEMPRFRKLGKSLSMQVNMDSDSLQRKSRSLKKAKSVLFSDNSTDSVVSPKIIKSSQKVIKKGSKKRSPQRSQSVLRDVSTERRQIFTRTLKKSSSMNGNETSVDSILRPKNIKTTKKKVPTSPSKPKVKRSQTHASLLSDRKGDTSRKLKTANSVILTEKSMSNLGSPKSPKKVTTTKTKTTKKRSIARSMSLRPEDVKQSPTHKLRKTNSLVPSDLSLPGSPKRDKSLKKFALKTPKKSVKKSPTKQASLLNLDSSRNKEQSRQYKQTSSLVLSDSSFANSPKRIRIVEKPKKATEKGSSLLNLDSQRKQKEVVVRKIKKSNSLAPSDRSLSMSPSPKRANSPSAKSPKKIVQRSQSRESSLINFDSERKNGLTKKIKKTNSLILSDSSFASNTKQVKITKKVSSKSPKKAEKPKSKGSSLRNLDTQENQEVARKLKKSNSLAPSDRSLSMSPKRSMTPVSKTPKKVLKKSHSKQASLANLDSERKQASTKKLRKTNSLVLSEASFASSPKKIKITKKTTKKSTKNPKKASQEFKSKGSSLLNVEVQAQEVMRKLMKSNSLTPSNKSLSLSPSPKRAESPKRAGSPKRSDSPKKFVVNTPKKTLKKSPSKEASSLVNLDSHRKKKSVKKLRKANSLVISNSFSFGNSPRRSSSPKKMPATSSPKKASQNQNTGPAGELSFRSLSKQEVIKKLKKASSMIVTDKTFIVGNPEGNNSPKMLRPKSPKKVLHRSNTRDASVTNFEIDRRPEAPKKLRKTHSLVMDDRTFEGVNDTKTFKSFRKIVAKVSKNNKSPEISQTQESIYGAPESERKSSNVAIKFSKSNSLVVSAKHFVVGNPEGPKSPKKIVSKKKILDSSPHSKQPSLLNIDSARRQDSPKKSRKTHSLVINDNFTDSMQSNRSLQSYKKIVAKVTLNRNPERPHSTVPDSDRKKKVIKKLKKATSMVPGSLSLDASSGLQSPKKLKNKTNELQRSRDPSLIDLDSPKRFKKLRKANSLVVNRSMDSFPEPYSIQSLRKFGSRSPMRTNTSQQASLMDVDRSGKKKTGVKKLRKAKSLMPGSSVSVDQSPTKKKKKNPKKLPLRSMTQGSMGGKSPLRKKSASKSKKPKKLLKSAGKLKDSAPVKEVKSVTNGKKGLTVVFQKNTGKDAVTPKKVTKPPLKTPTNKSQSSTNRSKATQSVKSRRRGESPPTFRDNSQILTNSMTATPIYLKRRNEDVSESSFQDLSLVKGRSGGSTGNNESPAIPFKPLDETLEFSSMRISQAGHASGTKKTPSSSFISTAQKPKTPTADKSMTKISTTTPKGGDKDKKVIKVKTLPTSVSKGNASELYEQISEKVKQKNQKGN